MRTHARVVVIGGGIGGCSTELHTPNEHLQAAYSALTTAGDAHGLVPFGMHALESMRIEKGYCHWKAEITSQRNPMETGLDRYVNMHKTFPGKAGLQAQLAHGAKKELVTLTIDSDFAPAQPEDAVLNADTVVGSVTSAAWGHRVGRNLAMAFVDAQQAGIGNRLDVLVLGRRLSAVVCERCLHDPENLVPRS